MIKSRNIIAIPPGATIREQLQDRGFTQKEFAVRMNMSEKHISKLINGEVQLTMDVAVRLETVLGVPAIFWNNLEAIYREKIIKATAENEMEADIKIARKIPYSKMAELGWVPDTKNEVEQVFSLRRFFEVVRLEILKDAQINRIAYRKPSVKEESYYALLAWVQKAKIMARDIQTKKMDIKELALNISKIRTIVTRQLNLSCQELTQVLAENGIALVILPQLEGTLLHGVTFYDGGKIVMGLTEVEKDIAEFQFSLFHELAHVLYGHIDRKEGILAEDECVADIFAHKMLDV